jgi:serine/threonine-protein kinase
MKTCTQCSATYPDDYAVCPKDGAALMETSLWQAGTVIRGKYKILARIGEGGMATVFKAHHQLLDELRALKVIHTELVRDGEFVKRFKNEAIMARKLNHPNAVRVDDLDLAEDGRPFIAMEFAEGETLKSLIQKAGSLPVSVVLDIAYQVCEALGAAHKIGMVHRDIKPDNVVLIPRQNANPIAKILDFGISRLREETSGSGRAAQGLTQTGVVIGTPEYMSPEQALGKRGDQLDGRSDLYSVGIVMYRMLTGELPFSADNTVEMILHHLKTPPRPPHELKPELGIPDVVSAIVMKALQKDREQRYGTAAEMAKAIKQARGSPTMVAKGLDLSAVGIPSTPAAKTPSAPASAATGARVGSTPTGIKQAGTTGTTPARPSASMAGATVFRASAKLPQATKELPVKWIVGGVAALALVVGGVAFWRHGATSKNVPASTVSSPATTGTSKRPGPRKSGAATVPPGTKSTVASEPSGSPAPTPTETQKTGTQASAPSQPKVRPAETRQPPRRSPPGQPAQLSPEQQARVVELNSLGEMYFKQKNYSKAVEAFQQALDVEPGNHRAWNGLQRCYRKIKNPASD